MSNYQIFRVFSPKALKANLWAFILNPKALEIYDNIKPWLYQALAGNYRLSLVLGFKWSSIMYKNLNNGGPA